jgi:hypothetical protein
MVLISQHSSRGRDATATAHLHPWVGEHLHNGGPFQRVLLQRHTYEIAAMVTQLRRKPAHRRDANKAIISSPVLNARNKGEAYL